MDEYSLRRVLSGRVAPESRGVDGHAPPYRRGAKPLLSNHLGAAELSKLSTWQTVPVADYPESVSVITGAYVNDAESGLIAGSNVRLRNARQVTDGEPGDIMIVVKIK